MFLTAPCRFYLRVLGEHALRVSCIFCVVRIFGVFQFFSLIHPLSEHWNVFLTVFSAFAHFWNTFLPMSTFFCVYAPAARVFSATFFVQMRTFFSFHFFTP